MEMFKVVTLLAHIFSKNSQIFIFCGISLLAFNF